MAEDNTKTVKYDITSKSVEILLETAQEFIQQIINPPLAEIGLLLVDKVKLWRFKNQLNIIDKAQEHLKRNNINPNKVSLKVLAPLLDFCSLEEDTALQDKWAALLANTAQNEDMNTSLYIHILSQLSVKDARLMEEIHTTFCEPERKEFSMYIIEPRLIDLREKDEIAIDNLVRLNLIRPTHRESWHILTFLGERFIEACRFKPR